MKYYKNWETGLMMSLYTKKQKALILNFDFAFDLPLNDAWVVKSEEQKLSKDFIDFYRLYDGLKIEWSGLNQTGGVIQFLKMEYVLQNWKGILYDERDLEENDLLDFYKPCCQISETYSCGFLITPNFVAESMYCHNAPENELHALDLNFKGFLEMASASEIYYYWPKVLLDLKCDKISPETKSFKTNLQLSFPEFKWTEYLQLYHSLRLSKSNSKSKN